MFFFCTDTALLSRSCPRRTITCAGLAIAVLAGAVTGAWAQEVPGAAGAPTEPRIAPEQGGAPMDAGSVADMPWLVVAPELDIHYGYNDNIFVTPDILGFKPTSDRFASISPRLRTLTPLRRTLGLVGDFHYHIQRFDDNGSARSFDGRLFLGYRPADHRHAEFGVRGSTTRVSEFSPSDSDSVGGFLHGTYGFKPESLFFAGLDMTVRDFPERLRRDVETEALLLGIAPSPTASPVLAPLEEESVEVREERGQEDDIASIRIGYQQRFDSGFLQVGYGFRDIDSDNDSLDSDNHRLRLTGARTWTDWLASQIDYSVRRREFREPLARSGSSTEREDTIHNASLELRLRPGFLRDLPLTRHATLKLSYAYLKVDSNIATAELERNILSLTLAFALAPVTSTMVGDAFDFF